jgi:hypothetical protein
MRIAIIDALSASSEKTERSVRQLAVGKPEMVWDYVANNLVRLRAMSIQVIADFRFVSDIELD